MRAEGWTRELHSIIPFYTVQLLRLFVTCHEDVLAICSNSRLTFKENDYVLGSCRTGRIGFMSAETFEVKRILFCPLACFTRVSTVFRAVLEVSCYPMVFTCSWLLDVCHSSKHNEILIENSENGVGHFVTKCR